MADSEHERRLRDAVQATDVAADLFADTRTYKTLTAKRE
jgi:hypothetical protein